MFSDKKNKDSMEPTNSQNRINEGTQLKGDVVSNGFFRIDGSIEGNISKPSKVVLGKTGSIKGKLVCEEADIEGRFEGNLNVSGTLTLKATAHIEGEVIVGKLSVEPGATFNATCTMHGTPKAKAPIEEISTPESLKSKNHFFDRSQRSQKAKAEQQN
ncbi:MAG: polymer-forming cytoskeletal protein [Flavobacteriaceae bacterium]|nr:polymer-forming cytoskeletal protein [Flavobacteriaceae bacterium]